MSPLPAPPPVAGINRKKVLGVTRPQMAFAFLAGAGVFLICTFLIPAAGRFVWSDLTWKDLLTFLTVFLVWTGTVIYNRYCPDEEIRLNLESPRLLSGRSPDEQNSTGK